ncbi:MAG: ABC transporter substrate-binding protein [Desulfomonilaceae bacterium]
MKDLPPMRDEAHGRRIFLAAFCTAVFVAAVVAANILATEPVRYVYSDGPPAQALAVDSQPSVDRANIRYAKGFTLEYHDTYKLLHVLSPWRDARVTFTYILVPRGGKVPCAPPGAMVIETPVRRMAAATTGCIPFLPMLHMEKTLVGFSGCKLLSTPEIAEMIQRKQIAEIGVGNGGMVRTLNMEQLYAIHPDVVMVYGTGLPEYDHHPKLIEAGFKTVIFASYMEASPLGRTEWIKFFAAFFNKEAEAERLFDEIASRYEAQAAKIRNSAYRPTVFCGSPYRGMMYVPGGRSYVAGLMADAGADYLWSDDTTSGSTPLSVESVVDRAREADFWLDPGASRSMSELAEMDERFSVFKAFRAGRVYNNDAKIGPNGGNDYWETGEARPDIVLNDLISIFHPDLLPSYRRMWYRQLPLRAEGEK